MINIKNKYTFLPEVSFVVVCVCLSACPSVSPLVNPQFVCAIPCHPFKLESPNLNKTCKTLCLKSLKFCGLIDLDLPDQFWLHSNIVFICTAFASLKYLRLAKTEYVELFNIPNGSAHVLIPKFWTTVPHHGPWSSLVVYLVRRSLASASCQLSLLKGYRGVFHMTVMHYHIQPDARRAYCRKSSLHMIIWQDRPLLAQMVYH